MRRELLELFRDTRLDPPGGTSRGATPPAGAAAEPFGARATPGSSPFLRRFLQRSVPAAEPARSGLVCLDSRLGGGFSSGLHVVLGEQARSKTAFLESLAWEAVSMRRPAMYYALREGSLRAWERLVATLGVITRGDDFAFPAPDATDLTSMQKETLIQLDAQLQKSVLPYLSLLDRAPGPPGDLRAFVERLRARSQEAAEQHGRLPLVLIDDLEELVAITASRSPTHLLSRLDAGLAGDSLPGIVTAGTDGSLGRADHPPVQTVMALVPASAGEGVSERVDLEIRENAATGWTGRVPLLQDPYSGLFADADPDC